MQRQPAHRRPTGGRWPVVLAVSAALLVLGGGAAGIVWAARTGHSTAAQAGHAPAVQQFHVVSTTPTLTASVVPSATTITVSFSSAVSPPVPGTWSLVSPTEVEFVPSAPLVPGVTESVIVPGGPTGMVSAQGIHLAAPTTVPFNVAPAQSCESNSCWPNWATSRCRSPRPPRSPR